MSLHTKSQTVCVENEIKWIKKDLSSEMRFRMTRWHHYTDAWHKQKKPLCERRRDECRCNLWCRLSVRRKRCEKYSTGIDICNWLQFVTFAHLLSYLYYIVYAQMLVWKSETKHGFKDYQLECKWLWWSLICQSVYVVETVYIRFFLFYLNLGQMVFLKNFK